MKFTIRSNVLCNCLLLAGTAFGNSFTGLVSTGIDTSGSIPACAGTGPYFGANACNPGANYSYNTQTQNFGSGPVVTTYSDPTTQVGTLADLSWSEVYVGSGMATSQALVTDGAAFYAGNWVADSVAGNWIGTCNCINTADHETTSTQQQFTISFAPSVNALNSYITLEWAADDNAVLSINGNIVQTLTGSSPSNYGTLHLVTINSSSPFCGGGDCFLTNQAQTLQVTITSNDNSYEGALVQILSSSDGTAIPEPGSLVLLGSGTVVLFAVVRRRRKV